MNLRLKIILSLVVVAVAVAVLVGAFSYRTTASELNAQIDTSLRDTTEQLLTRPLLNGEFPRLREQPLNRALRNFRSPGDVVVQVIGPGGATFAPAGSSLPVDEVDSHVAQAPSALHELRYVTIDGVRYRMMTVGLGNGNGAVQAARSMTETDAVLNALRSRILIASITVAAAAALIGWLLARQITGRLLRLTSAAEVVANTRDPAVQVPVSGSDETARLGKAFNDMLLALTHARAEQQRLVQNAGHELRTPLTSLRTNVFALTHADNIPDEQRQRILSDLRSETEELTLLVNEVVDLASDRREAEPLEQVLIRDLVEQAVARARQRTSRELRVTTDESIVMARSSLLLRAITNLVDNAVKFDTSGDTIEVSSCAGRVEVADRGPGIGVGESDLVFERFYRAESSRSLPGSGLGLAIVADIVADHGGTVFAYNRDGGGAAIGFQLPTLTIS